MLKLLFVAVWTHLTTWRSTLRKHSFEWVFVCLWKWLNVNNLKSFRTLFAPIFSVIIYADCIRLIKAEFKTRCKCSHRCCKYVNILWFISVLKINLWMGCQYHFLLTYIRYEMTDETKQHCFNNLLLQMRSNWYTSQTM